MIFFVICNQYENIIKKISDTVIKTMSFYNETYEILDYDLFDEQLEKFIIEKNKEKVVYILDVNLKYGEYGIEIAKYVREKCNKNKEIIFYTNSANSVLQTYDYKIKPVDYILTNSKYCNVRLEKAIKEAINLLLNSVNIPKKINIKENNKEYFITLNDIMYISKIKGTKKISIQTKQNKIVIKETLRNIKKKLNANFIRVHKSCIVNVNFIREINKKRSEEEIIMIDGGRCPLSRQKIKELSELKNSITSQPPKSKN